MRTESDAARVSRITSQIHRATRRCLIWSRPFRRGATGGSELICVADRAVAQRRRVGCVESGVGLAEAADSTAHQPTQRATEEGSGAAAGSEREVCASRRVVLVSSSATLAPIALIRSAPRRSSPTPHIVAARIVV